MGAVVATQVAKAGPVSTTERVMVAWSHATPTARRATVLAAGTSPILGAMAPTAVSVRIGISIAGVLLALAASVDVHERRLPNRLLALATAALFVGAVIDGLATTASAGMGALVALALMLTARLRGGVGLGDVKAAGVVGAAAGVLAVTAALVAIAVASGTAAMVGVIRRRAALPLGPSLWFGWAVATVLATMGPLARVR
ncbi:MAG: prepilin peptidase [Ilumatobacteraceae bacterium]